MNGKLLHISRCGLPIDASGIRIDSILRLFEMEGYTCHCICDRNIDVSIERNGYFPENQGRLPAYLIPSEIHYRVQERIYSYLPQHSGRIQEKIRSYLNIRLAHQIWHRVMHYCKTEQPECIVLYGVTCLLEKRLLNYCKRHRITLIADVVEWYEQNRRGKSAERFIADTTDRRIRKIDHRLDGIIAISPFLQQYYNQKGAHTILIPPLMKTAEVQAIRCKSPEEPIRFVYAGSPGSKDIIIPFIKALIRVNQKELRCIVDLIGVNEQYLVDNGWANVCEVNGVIVHGRLPHDQTMALVKQADFGILLRHAKRYAKAGFSTKFTECMSLGVGMICNRVGGTDLYVEDGVDGFLLDDVQEETIYQFLLRVLAMDAECIGDIKRNAQKKARTLFAADAYMKSFHAFLDGTKR